MMEMVMLTAERSSVAATRDLLPLWQPGYGSIDKRSLLLMPIDKVWCIRSRAKSPLSQVYALLCPKVFLMVAEVLSGKLRLTSPHGIQETRPAERAECAQRLWKIDLPLCPGRCLLVQLPSPPQRTSPVLGRSRIQPPLSIPFITGVRSGCR